MEFFWENPSWEREDAQLSGLRAMPFQRPFPTFPTARGAYFIRGPRQIGKSCWLKTILSRELGRRRSCFYMSCETLADFRDLAEVLKSIRGRDVVLLDEISFVPEWWRPVKHELDRGSFAMLVLTGSHAVDVRRGMDQMPGRWAPQAEHLLLPMEFAEFQAMRAMAGWPRLSRLDELRLYLRVGGFPTALSESGPAGKTPDQAIEVYRRWLLGDLARFGKQEVYLKELLLAVAQTTTSTMSLQTLARRTQMGSHHTAQDYVQILEDCFALKTLYAMDPNTGGYRFKKEKKFYFRDPLLYWLAYSWAGIMPPNDADAQIAELVAHEHLARRHQRLGYLSLPSGEVDFLSPNRWALEVKWSPIPQHLSRAFKDLRILEKLIWTQSNFLLENPRD